MAISYEWRGEFTSAEANALHAECFGHPVLGDHEWDWRGQVETTCAASTSTPAGSPRPTPA